jgi:hypothetical protein
MHSTISRSEEIYSQYASHIGLNPGVYIIFKLCFFTMSYVILYHLLFLHFRYVAYVNFIIIIIIYEFVLKAQEKKGKQKRMSIKKARSSNNCATTLLQSFS